MTRLDKLLTWWREERLVYQVSSQSGSVWLGARSRQDALRQVRGHFRPEEQADLTVVIDWSKRLTPRTYHPTSGGSSCDLVDRV